MNTETLKEFQEKINKDIISYEEHPWGFVLHWKSGMKCLCNKQMNCSNLFDGTFAGTKEKSFILFNSNKTKCICTPEMKCSEWFNGHWVWDPGRKFISYFNTTESIFELIPEEKKMDMDFDFLKRLQEKFNFEDLISVHAANFGGYVLRFKNQKTRLCNKDMKCSELFDYGWNLEENGKVVFWKTNEEGKIEEHEFEV